MGILVLLLIAVAACAVWYVHVRIRPWKTCRACGGAGRIKGKLVRGTHSDCRRCGATGRVRRAGARRR